AGRGALERAPQRALRLVRREAATWRHRCPTMTREMAVEPADRPSGFDRRTRLASEIATWGIAFAILASAALPTTTLPSRGVLLVVAVLLAVFAVLWFRVIPERVFGRLRFTIGTCVTQLLAAFLINATGDVGSPYFVFFLIPILTTTFAMQLGATLVTGAVAVAAFVVMIVVDLPIASSSSPVMRPWPAVTPWPPAASRRHSRRTRRCAIPPDSAPCTRAGPSWSTTWRGNRVSRSGCGPATDWRPRCSFRSSTAEI